MTTFPNSSSPKRRRSLRIATDLPLHSLYSYDSPLGLSSPTNQSLTPSGTTPSIGILEYAPHVLCMYDFDSPDPDHLCFSGGEVLSIIKKEESGWWAAMRPQGDRIGWIPGSFVKPLTSDELDNPQTPQGHRGALEFSNEISWRRPEFDDSPQTAIHESWVRVSEDHKVRSLQLATPTDLVPHNSFLDDAYAEHAHASFVDLSDDERFSSVTVEFRFQPPTPHTLAPRSARGLHFPPSPCSPLPLKGLPQLVQSVTPWQPEGASLRRHPRTRSQDIQQAELAGLQN